MPLNVYLNPKRSPYWRIRGIAHGVPVDESSKVTGKREAEQIAERRAAEIKRSHIAGAEEPKKAKLTFADAVSLYITDPIRPAADTRFLDDLVRHFGGMTVDKIGQDELDAYTRKYHMGNKPSTVSRHAIDPLRAVLRYAGEQPKFRLPKLQPTRLRYLTRDEADRLIACASPHLKPLIIFCLNTGARMGEALSLEWTEVDLTARRVMFLDTKNGESRGVPLNIDVVEALANRDYPTGIIGPDGKRERKKIRKGRVFRTPGGADYPLHEHGGGQVKTAWRGACGRAGIKGATPHTMRHTFASWLVMKKVPLRTVAELLGHKTLAMVMRYSHLAPDHLADAVDAISGQKPGSAEKIGEKASNIK